MKLPYSNLPNRPNGCVENSMLTGNPKSFDMGIPCYFYPEYIQFCGELAKRTEYDGYYATQSGKIISVKVKSGRGKIDLSNPREHCYKIDKDGYLECCFSMFDGKK